MTTSCTKTERTWFIGRRLRLVIAENGTVPTKWAVAHGMRSGPYLFKYALNNAQYLTPCWPTSLRLGI